MPEMEMFRIRTMDEKGKREMGKKGVPPLFMSNLTLQI